jgi:single-strand DNA-binding protein
MPNVNRAEIIGRVNSDPTQHTTKSGKLVSQFGVTTESEHSGEIFIQRHNVTTWMDDASWVLDNVQLGQTVRVEGEMRTRSYPGADGQKRYSFEVVALPIRHGGIIIF